MYRQISLLLTALLLSSAVLPATLSAAPGNQVTEWNPNGLDHVSWLPLAPMPAATFVEFDPNSYMDDWAYLAALPTSVFSANGQVYGAPLLFWEDPAPEGTPREQMPLFGYQSNQYLMEDWMVVNGGKLDRLQLIQMEEVTEDRIASDYTANDVKTFDSTSAYNLASMLALDNWEFADSAVVAIIDHKFPNPAAKVEGSVSGLAPGGELVEETKTGSKTPDPVNPNVHPFKVPEGYKFVDAFMEWTWLGQTILPDGSTVSERGKDLDLQLYDDQIGEVVASEFWNVIEGDLYRPQDGPYEQADTYAYHEGDWDAYVTYMPTKGYNNIGSEAAALPAPPKQGNEDSRAHYTIYLTLFPGVDVDLPDPAPMMTGPASYTLEWEGTDNLGLVIRGPSGAALARDISDANPKTVSFTDLGEGDYSASVINLDDNSNEMEFTLSYSYEPVLSKAAAFALGNAANGAVWASLNNIPLLYANDDELPETTGEALKKLGVDKVYLVDMADRGEKAKEGIGDLTALLQDGIDVKHYTDGPRLYQDIQAKSGQNDVIFSSLRGWRPWTIQAEWDYLEYPEATYLGPAAMSAAYHGAPLLITDLHPELSAPVAWHNAFWQHAYRYRLPPGVGPMYLTGTMVYDFLSQHGLADDLIGEQGITDPGEKESLVTVAGQFVIGQAWDRMFPGVADAGRIFGTPTDTAAWVARSGLYPSLIWANPAVNPEVDNGAGGKWITGSHSKKEQGGNWGIIEPEQEVEAMHNIAQSWVSYQHRFNERASKHWGSAYTGPAGLTPFETPSNNPIDENVNLMYGGAPNTFPDMTTSDIIPYYATKGGYPSVFTTNFEKTMENLNRGTLLWVEVMHGGHQSYGDHSGVVGFWDSENQNEKNPWRGYESEGASDETFLVSNSGATLYGPDTVTMSKYAGADLEPAVQDPTGTYENHDGVIIAIAQQIQTNHKTGFDFEEHLENIHSMGFNGGSCLIADTYLHLSMVRHGSVYQVIDPWLTSWYVAVAIEMFVRGLALGATVGEAYSEGIHNVGIEYLTKQWWWDIFENVVYFGDPDLRMWSPLEDATYSLLEAPGLTWTAPPMVDMSQPIGGHAPGGADSHPHAMGSKLPYQLGVGVLVIGAALVAVVGYNSYVRERPEDELEALVAGTEEAEQVLEAEQ